MKKTKIIATVWPTTDTIEKLENLYKAWANIIRLNFSHWNHEYFSKIITNINSLNKSWKTNLSILLDTKWPEIRTKKTEEVIFLDEGEELLITSLLNEDKVEKKWNKIIVSSYEYIVSDLEIWNIIDIDSSLLKVEVIEKNKYHLKCRALNKHKVESLRHINLPWIEIKLPWLNDKDKEDILFWIQNRVDFVALSFVRNKKNIEELKKFLKKNNWDGIKIISKIENQQWIENIDEIIDESDWIMIARWDLWAEVDFETIPVLQKMIWDKCKFAWKFFIVATQMLESMINNNVPTRAEVTDIYNACMQKADCTMLSWETANWKYPIEAVSQMQKVIKYSETQIVYKHNYFWKDSWEENDKKNIIKNAVYTAEGLDAKAIIIFTWSWYLAKTMSAFKPGIPVYAFTFDEKVVKKLNILFWIYPFKIEKKSFDDNMKQALTLLKQKWLISTWEKVVNICNIKQDWKTITSIQIRNI